MNLLGLFNSVKTFVVTQVGSIAKAVMSASTENLIKGGIFMGTAVYTGYILISTLAERRRKYKERKEMSTVDRALALNYADKENRKNLSPLFKKVNKAFDSKECTPKSKFAPLTKQEKEAIRHMNRLFDENMEKIQEQLNQSNGSYVEEDGEEEIRTLRKDMKELKRMEKRMGNSTSFRDILHS